jgi:hypothetical protein
MYIGVLTLVAGWAIFLNSPVIALYMAVLSVGFHIRVLVKEEPGLSLRFGTDWAHYSANVNRWLPRLKPWRGDSYVPGNFQNRPAMMAAPTDQGKPGCR